jgi:succinate-acetate transporter protein
MNDFFETQAWKAIVGVAILILFIGGIAVAIYGFWLKRRGDVIPGKRMIAIGVFTAFFALVASLIETPN